MLPPAVLRPSLHVLGRWIFSPRADWQTRRRRMGMAVAAVPTLRGLEVRETVLGAVPLGAVPVERLSTPAGTAAGTLLYLHGGGYCMGEPRGYRPLVGRLAAKMGVEAVVVDYRCAPENAWPAALEDAVAVYDALLAEGIAPERIVVAGDSAGGHLTLALALALRDAGKPQPAALGLICPWLDMRPGAIEARPDASRDPFLSPGIMAAFTREVLAGGADPQDPLVSPITADLRGLAPIVLHSAGDDPLRDEAAALAARAADQGAPLEHRRFDGVWHVVHLHDLFLDLDASGELAAALSRHLAR